MNGRLPDQGAREDDLGRGRVDAGTFAERSVTTHRLPRETATNSSTASSTRVRNAGHHPAGSGTMARAPSRQVPALQRLPLREQRTVSLLHHSHWLPRGIPVTPIRPRDRKPAPSATQYASSALSGCCTTRTGFRARRPLTAVLERIVDARAEYRSRPSARCGFLNDGDGAPSRQDAQRPPPLSTRAARCHPAAPPAPAAARDSPSPA